MADYKAVSMNLMHKDIRITDGIYAPLLGDEVRERVARLSRSPAGRMPADGELAAFLRNLSDGELSQALMIVAERLAQ
jgi:hypothetical protein